ncbi:hypothetical protein RvY_15282 [Ramazzottius varieornatus]|uniref:Uncharacterized protein n=1 Tax=Ramazzottius varieornatus TaxID=947166 RepID=A0A1D1VXS3_RAMVA|nr:hypothetical protein RvY_15282 [Ramazzottius varieornatus]
MEKLASNGGEHWIRQISYVGRNLKLARRGSSGQTSPVVFAPSQHRPVQIPEPSTAWRADPYPAL